jgi:5-formyltetrahydrofolate cyclo-ligase
MNSIAEQKASLRRHLIAARRRIPVDRRIEYNRLIHDRLLEIPELRNAGTVFCFLAQADEFDTRPLIDTFLASGKTVVVPKIIKGRPMIAVKFEGWDKLVRGQLGIAVPVSDEEFTGSVDVVITPGVGFALNGDRLGFGRGYYDGWFAAHPVPVRIAPCYECQIAESIPTDENDMPVTCVATESRIVHL